MLLLAIGAIPVVLWLYPDAPSGKPALIMAILALRPIFEAVYAAPLAGLRSERRYRTVAAIDGTSQFAASIATVVLAVGGAGALSLVVPKVFVLGITGAAYRRFWRPMRRPSASR